MPERLRSPVLYHTNSDNTNKYKEDKSINMSGKRSGHFGDSMAKKIMSILMIMTWVMAMGSDKPWEKTIIYPKKRMVYFL